MYPVLLYATTGGVALLIAASMRLRSVVSSALAAYIVFVANVGLATWGLSPVRGVTRGGLLTFEAVLLAAAAAVWWRRGRPRPALGVLRQRVSEVMRDPASAAFVAFVVLLLAYELVVALTAPANNWDSLTYHLSRAAAWFHHHGILRARRPADGEFNEFRSSPSSRSSSDSSRRERRAARAAAVPRGACDPARDLRRGPPARLRGARSCLQRLPVRDVLVRRARGDHGPERPVRRVVPCGSRMSHPRRHPCRARAWRRRGGDRPRREAVDGVRRASARSPRARARTPGDPARRSGGRKWACRRRPLAVCVQPRPRREPTGSRRLDEHRGGRPAAGPPGGALERPRPRLPAPRSVGGVVSRIRGLWVAAILAAGAAGADLALACPAPSGCHRSRRCRRAAVAPVLVIAGSAAVAWLAREHGAPVRGQLGNVGPLNRSVAGGAFGPLGAVVLLLVPLLVFVLYALRRVDLRQVALACALPLFLFLLAQLTYNWYLTRFLLIPAALTAPLAARLFTSRAVTCAYLLVGALVATLVVTRDPLRPLNWTIRPSVADDADPGDRDLRRARGRTCPHGLPAARPITCLRRHGSSTRTSPRSSSPGRGSSTASSTSPSIMRSRAPTRQTSRMS